MLTEIQEKNLQNGLQSNTDIQDMSMRFQTIEAKITGLDYAESLAGLRKELAQLSSRLASLSRDHQILQSLAFPSMTVRHSNIVDAHKRTFSWIFRSHLLPKTDIRSTIDFKSWLRRDEGVYWISGKPGTSAFIVLRSWSVK